MNTSADLRFNGFPTTPAIRAYLESIGLELYQHDDTGPYCWEKWAVTSSKAFVTEADPQPDYVLIRWCPSDSLEKGEVFYYGFYNGSRTCDVIQQALFPKQAENEFGSRICQTVMANEDFLGFNLYKFTGSEIVNALRLLATSKKE